jgi:hypothetical protein
MNKKESFGTGFIVGVLLLGGALLITGNTAEQLNNKWKNDVVSHGYAQWIVVTNSAKPTVEFQWK